MSDIIARFAHYMADYEGVTVPVQVFDSTSNQVFAKPVPLSSTGSRLEQSFGSGTYLIRVTLPSGEILVNTVAVQSGTDAVAVFKPKRQSPREELSWAYYLQRAPASALERASRIAGFSVFDKLRAPLPSERPKITFWMHDTSGWKIISEKASDIFTNVHYEAGPDLEREGALLRIGIEFRKFGDWRQFPAQIWLQARTSAGSQFAALPTMPQLHVLIAAEDAPQSILPFRIQSSNGSPTVDALLSFLSSGDFESARAIGSTWTQRAEEMLFSKMDDPMAAVVAGYFLLQAGEIRRLHEWTANLANWFEWLPDGPIIRACHLMTQAKPNAAAIRRLLLDAVKRGVPYYTIGLRMLQNGLKLLLQRHSEDDEIAVALETINPYLEAADPSLRAVSFVGETPDQPGAFREPLKPHEQPASRESNMPCSRRHSQYIYSASAYAIAADFDRPKNLNLPPQAAVVLAAHGGHNTQRVAGQKSDGLVSFKEAYSEVGGSFDDCHDIYTTHAWSVLEGVNIADMFTADRVVSRMAVYHPAHGEAEPSFDIIGSYFENLRIAGHPIDVKLATNVFHEHDTYSKLAKAHHARKTDDWLVGGKLMQLKDNKLAELENEYHALIGMSGWVKEWKKPKRQEDRGGYWFSPANHFDWKAQGGSPEIQGFGSIICIPKFGVIRLAEMVVHRHSRTLQMFRVQMCSPGYGTATGGSSSAGGGVD